MALRLTDNGAIAMQCLQVTDSASTLELTEQPVPEVGPGEVLVDVVATSVGRTVYRNIHGKVVDRPDNLPRIPAHELVGRVDEVGPGVSHVAEGDLVTPHYYLFCGHCEMCEAGYEPLCANLRGQVGVEIDGGYAEFAKLPGRNLVVLPEELDPVEATAIPDAIATPYHVADRRARIKPDDQVMILGAGGGVGIHLVQMARHYGGTVTAVDQRTAKLDRCAAEGAARTIDTREESLADLEETYDVIVNFTGAMDLVAEATDRLAPAGRFVHLTAFAGQSFACAPRALVRRECDVVGSRYCSRYEIRRSAELVVDGVIDPVITEVVDLPEVPALFETLEAENLVGRGAVRL